MKVLGWLLALGAAYIGYTVISRKGRAIDFLQYSILRFKVITPGLSRTKIELTVAVDNQSSEALSFQRFFGVINMAGAELGRFLHDSKSLTIKPNGTTDISFPVYIQNTTVVQLIKKFFKDKDTGALELKGTLDVANVQVPVSVSYRINLAELLGGGVKKAVGAVLN